MKQFLFFITLITCTLSVTAQGEFAGTKSKELIGKKFNNDRVLPGLEDYKYRQSTLASDSDDPEQFSVAVFQKGPTYIVLFTINKDSTIDDYTILDVLVVKQVKKDQDVRVLLCRQNKQSNIELVAVTQTSKSGFSPALRTWRFNREKRKFETYSSEAVDCMNEED